MKVKLQDIIDGMEMQFEGSRTFLYRLTGEVISVSNDVLRDAEVIEDEEIDQLIEWQQEDMRRAIDIIENFENYEELPTNFDINEYDMMQDFCDVIDNERHSETLSRAIQGKGAFRRFKDKVSILGIADEWSRFRNECYKRKAIEWCQDNDLEYK